MFLVQGNRGGMARFEIARKRNSPSCPRSTARMKSSVRSIVVRWSTIVDPVPPLSPIQDNSFEFPYFPGSRSSCSTFLFVLDGHDPRSTQYARVCNTSTDESSHYSSSHYTSTKTNSHHRARRVFAFLFSSFPSSRRNTTNPFPKNNPRVSNRPTNN